MKRTLIPAAGASLTNLLVFVVVGTSLLLTTEANADPIEHVVQANGDLTFDLYRRLTQENDGENVFFSSYSILSALAMTAEGARGETAMEMGKVLRFPKATRMTGGDAGELPWQMSLIHGGIGGLNTRLTAGGDKASREAAEAEIARLRKAYESALAAPQQQPHPDDPKVRAACLKLNEALRTLNPYELRIANSLWGERTYPFAESYVDTISKHYKTSGVFSSDFINNAKSETKRINDWVAENTENRIKNICPQLSPDTRLVLANAIYFKGDWVKPFEVRHTKPRDFTLADGKRVKTPIMHANNLAIGRYGAFNKDGSVFDTPWQIRPGKQENLYPDQDGFALLELPYKGDDLSMVLIAPNRHDGVPALERSIDAPRLTTWLGKLQQREVHVFVPKFKMQTDYDLKNTLQEMGMVRAFSPSDASFRGMCASADPAMRLYIGLVLHKAFVEVNEKGTEAAAATVVGVMVTAAPGAPVTVPFTPTFKADRPFMFLIRDVKSGAILFTGRMMKPPH